MRYFRTLILCALVSLLIHGGLYEAIQRVAPATTPPSRPLTVVELLEKPELARRPQQEPFDTQQYIRSAPVPEELLTNEERKKRFASEHDQSVIEEQKASRSGLTANRSGSSQEELENGTSGGIPGLRAKPTQPQTAPQDRLSLAPTSPLEKGIQEHLAQNDSSEELDEGLGDVSVSPTQTSRRPSSRASDSQDLNIPSFLGADQGVSTLGSPLPDDIKVGDFTALNTDRHLFYTFYSRIEEGIRHRWVTYIRGVLASYEARSHHFSRDTLSTKLEIVLDPEGNFVRAILHESSGLQGLDSAPVQAFRDARQFPNPPRELIKDDGTIRVLYEFHVNITPLYASGG